MADDVLNGRLLPGERIIWSGQPSRGLMFAANDVFMVPFSLAWCGFAIFWEVTALGGRGAPGFLPLWGAMFVCIGLYLYSDASLWTRGSAVECVTPSPIVAF